MGNRLTHKQVYFLLISRSGNEKKKPYVVPKLRILSKVRYNIDK